MKKGLTPMMPPRTTRYLDLVHQGRSERWRYALGIVTIGCFWLVAGYLPYGWFQETLAAHPLFDFVAVNFSILMMLAGLAVTVKWIHRRPLLGLVTPERRIEWTRAARSAAAWFVLAALAAVAEHWLFPGRYYLTFEPYRFGQFAMLVLALTPLQCATEELVFRGYAMQGLGLLTRRPGLLAIASSLLFTLPHLLNPEVYEHGVLAMAANYFTIGLLLSAITLRDGRLELAIGVHTANNVFIALFANYEGSALTTDAVFTARELDPYYSLATLVAGGLVLYCWLFRRAEAPP